MNRFLHLLGRYVSVALADGTRLDDCLLVSVPSKRTDRVWVYLHGKDRFLPRRFVVDIWEARR